MKAPVPYTPELAEMILVKLAEGKSLRSICKGPGVPSAPSVRDWVNADPVFAEQYVRARAEGLEQWAEEIVDISDDATGDYALDDAGKPIPGAVNSEHIQRSKLRVDSRKWLLSKLVPKIYGDKQVIEHQGEIKLTDRLLRARSR